MQKAGDVARTVIAARHPGAERVRHEPPQHDARPDSSTTTSETVAGRPLRANSGASIVLGDEIVSAFWVWMADRYGTRWTSQYTADPFPNEVRRGRTVGDSWLREIGDISATTIAAALRRCTRDFPNWPPTAGEFRALCSPVHGQDAQARIPFERRLPEPPAEKARRRATANEAIDHAFAMLGRERTRGEFSA